MCFVYSDREQEGDTRDFVVNGTGMLPMDEFIDTIVLALSPFVGILGKEIKPQSGSCNEDQVIDESLAVLYE